MNDASIGLMAAEAFDMLIDAVDRIAPERWSEPSNLEGWTLRDLVGHTVGSAAKIVTLVEDGEIWAGPSRPADFDCDDPVGRLRELAARLREALPGADLDALRVSPEGEVPLRRALIYPVSDLALHTWDIERSQGRQIELPDDLLALCRGLLGSVPESGLRRPGGFGPAQPVPPGATETAQLMAYLGRSVHGRGQAPAS
ncbi:TIGR03086 family metal-binding protein [Mycobacterium sp. 050134]|uniref:TIGR03086 family metal-binding protein n=1 Tax=Mycobacterium sp. 050134 TaxID=3096111 RepID=UPI002ED868F6